MNDLSFDKLPLAVGQVLVEISVLKDRIESLSTNSLNVQNPHLTRDETAQFYGVSKGCIDDWSRRGILTPYKVCNRTYFKRSECVEVLFNRKG